MRTWTITCGYCEKVFETKSPAGKFCCKGCSVKACQWRKRHGTEPPATLKLMAAEEKANKKAGKKAKPEPDPESKPGPSKPPVVYDTLAEQVRTSLTEMLAFDTISGMAAFRIAQQIDLGNDSGAAVATLSKELSRLVAEAKIEALPRHRDGVDDLSDKVGATVLSLVG